MAGFSLFRKSLPINKAENQPPPGRQNSKFPTNPQNPNLLTRISSAFL